VWADLFAGPLELRKGDFSRGFVAGSAEGWRLMPAEAFVATSAAWWPRLPFRHVHVYTRDQFPDELLDCDHLRRLTRLELQKGSGSQEVMREEFVVRLFGCDRFDRLVAFDTTFVPLSRPVVDAIRSAPFLRRLRRLCVQYCCLRHSGSLQFPDYPTMVRGDGLADRPGGAKAMIGRDLRRWANELLVVPPGETRWEALIEFTRRGGKE
jgi:hypothetical protein